MAGDTTVRFILEETTPTDRPAQSEAKTGEPVSVGPQPAVRPESDWNALNRKQRRAFPDLPQPEPRPEAAKPAPAAPPTMVKAGGQSIPFADLPPAVQEAIKAATPAGQPMPTAAQPARTPRAATDVRIVSSIPLPVRVPEQATRSPNASQQRQGGPMPFTGTPTQPIQPTLLQPAQPAPGASIPSPLEESLDDLQNWLDEKLPTVIRDGVRDGINTSDLVRLLQHSRSASGPLRTTQQAPEQGGGNPVAEVVGAAEGIAALFAL